MFRLLPVPPRRPPPCKCWTIKQIPDRMSSPVNASIFIWPVLLTIPNILRNSWIQTGKAHCYWYRKLCTDTYKFMNSLKLPCRYGKQLKILLKWRTKDTIIPFLKDWPIYLTFRCVHCFCFPKVHKTAEDSGIVRIYLFKYRANLTFSKCTGCCSSAEQLSSAHGCCQTCSISRV